MSGSVSSVSARPGLQAAALRWREMAAWWKAGARATVPPRWIAAWTGSRRATLVLSRVEGTWICRRIEGGRAEPVDLGPSGFSLQGLAAWLSARGLARDDVRLALGLPRDEVFLRPIAVPEAALSRLDAILGQDVARRTPFAPGEIWHGADVVAGSGPTRTVRHWIVRRDFVRRALASLGLDEAAVDAVAVEEPSGPPWPMIALRNDGRERERGVPWRLLRGLGLAALLATVVALAGADAVEGRRAARIADALDAVRLDTEGGAAGGRDLRALLAIKALPGFGTAWAELSRIVPDDTVLTELRFDDGSLTMRGSSSNPAGLVRIVDASPLFTAAALSGGIEPGPEAGRDRFGLALDLRARPPRKGRPAGGIPR